MDKRQLISLAAGLGAAALFLLPFVIGAGLLFLFLPLLPMFMVGFSLGAKFLLLSSAAATLLVLALAGSGAGLFFLLFLTVPALMLARQSLLWRTAAPSPAHPEPAREWYPLGYAVTELTAYLAFAFLGIALYYASVVPGGLEASFAAGMAETSGDMRPEYRQMMEQLITGRSYLVFASGGWIWGLATCAMALLAHRLLREWRRNIRPTFTLLPFALPSWLLGLLTLAGVASLMGAPQSLFIGKTLLLLLLLPFFLHGMALLHEVSRAWPSRTVMLGAIYILLLGLVWPALLIACAGVIQQCRLLGRKIAAGE